MKWGFTDGLQSLPWPFFALRFKRIRSIQRAAPNLGGEVKVATPHLSPEVEGSEGEGETSQDSARPLTRTFGPTSPSRER